MQPIVKLNKLHTLDRSRSGKSPSSGAVGCQAGLGGSAYRRLAPICNPRAFRPYVVPYDCGADNSAIPGLPLKPLRQALVKNPLHGEWSGKMLLWAF